MENKINKENQNFRGNEYIPSKGENIAKAVGGVCHSLLKVSALGFCVTLISYATSSVLADIIRNKNKKKNYGE